MNSLHSPARIAAARIANDIADTPRGTRREPARFGSNWSNLPSKESWKAPAFNLPSPRPQAKPTATLSPSNSLQATLAQGKDKVIFVPSGKFKVLKNGERREIKFRVEIWSRSVTIGPVTYSFSSRASSVTLSGTLSGNGAGRQDGYSKINDALILPATLRRSPAEVAATSLRILPATAASLTAHLFNGKA